MNITREQYEADIRTAQASAWNDGAASTTIWLLAREHGNGCQQPLNPYHGGKA